MKNSYTYSLAPLNHNFYNFSSNISKYNENKRILNRKNNNINRINNNNVFNLNSYQINSSPKIFKYTFKNNIENSPYNSTKAKIINQKRARNSKYISDNSSFMSHKKIKDINSRKDFLNNSLSKGNLSMNKSSKYFYPNFKERYASKKNSRIYNESDFNDSINNTYYNKNRNYSHKNSSINKRNNNFSRAVNKSYTLKRNYSNHSINLHRTDDKNSNDYFNQVIILKDNIINQQKKKINDLSKKLLEKIE